MTVLRMVPRAGMFRSPEVPMNEPRRPAGQPRHTWKPSNPPKPEPGFSLEPPETRDEPSTPAGRHRPKPPRPGTERITGL